MLREQLTPWGAHKVSRIEWVVLSHQIKFGYRCGPAFQCAIETLEYALEEIDVTLDELQETPSWLPPMVRRTICANEGWTLAAQNELRVSRAMNAPAAIVNTEFSSLANPFGTALQLWAKGYVLDHAREFEYPAARLFTLTVDTPPNLAQQIIERSKLNS